MSPYTAVSFKMGKIERAILCDGPLGSVGLAVLYNMCVIQYSEVMGSLGPVDENIVTSKVRLMLQTALENNPNAVAAALRKALFNVITEHQRLSVCPVLVGPQDFKVSHSVWLFLLMGIKLLHGWVLDPEVSFYLSIKAHNRDELLQYQKELEDQEDQTENLALVQRLLNAAENQLTDYGFKCLFPEIAENGFAVVFCYNRFNIVHKHEGKLFILETRVVVRHNFPGGVWRFFDGGALEDSILLTGEYILVAGQPNYEEKVTKWAREMSTNVSNENSSQKGNVARNQKRKDQRKRAKEKKNANADVIKDDSKKEDGQGPKKKENKPSGSAQVKMTSEENVKSLGNISLEPLKPEEANIAPPQGIDCFPAAPVQGQSADVSNFLNFLLCFKHDGDSSYFRGIVEAFKETHRPFFFVPYEFIMQHDELLARKIQDHYPSISEDLKESVVQYLQKYGVTCPDVHLKILGLPKPKSVQTFEDYVASIVLLEVYEMYGGGLDKLPSYDGRKMSLGYLHCILDKFRTGRCWGGEWDEQNMRVHNGSEFVIHCKQDKKLIPDSGIPDLLKYSQKVLQRFEDEDGKLPSYFDEFGIDCLLFPDPDDTVKWERFLELIGSPFGLKHPLVRSSFVCNSYLAANSHTSGEPPRYMPLYHRKGCEDWRPALENHPLFEKVFSHQKGPRPRDFKGRYLLDPWGITHWSLVKYSRHFIQYVLRHTKGHDLVQQIKDIAVVDILLSRRLGKYIAKFVRFLVFEIGVDGLFSSPWRHFVASDCTDKPQGNIGLKDASTIDELLSRVSEEV